jgi:glycosyltransferase involved in cell wall biosynthesis
MASYPDSDVRNAGEGPAQGGGAVHDVTGVKKSPTTVNVLTYVHLRNIVDSTGAGRVARHLTESLARRSDVHIHILADAGDYQKVIGKLAPPWRNLQYHLFESDTSVQQARWVLTGAPEAANYWPHADIVYCTAESYVPTRGQRLVVTVHDAAIFERGAHRLDYRLLKQRLKWRVLYEVLARQADLFHTVSHFSAERLAHYFPAIRSRIRVVHNAAPERFFGPVSPQGEEFRERLGLKDRPYILVPGGLHYRKNADAVLKAAAVLPGWLRDYQLVIAGHCDPHYVQPATACGASLLLTGFVDDEALCSLYTGARVVWFPSKYEGFGVPILEAMACGVPVVTSDVTAIPETAGDAAILIEPEAVCRHLEALKMVCEDSRLRDCLIARGRARAKQFTWSSSAAKLISHFRAVI